MKGRLKKRNASNSILRVECVARVHHANGVGICSGGG